jgi:hypothetical protein
LDYYICVDEEESMRIKSLSEISDDGEEQHGNRNTENSQESDEENNENRQPNADENSQEIAPDTEKVIEDFMEMVEDEIN